MINQQSFKLILFFALFLFFLLPPTDPDLGWQLRCGQEIWQKNSFCQQNHFSILLENYLWPNHHWLYQAIIFPIFKFFSFWGLTILNGLLMALSFLFFFLSIKNFSLEKLLALILLIIFSWGVFSFGLRSQLLGIFFFNLLLFINHRAKTFPKLKLFFPLITTLWTNTHGSFVLGLFLIAFLSPTFFPISFFATLLNPYGFSIYQEVWRHFAGPVDLSKIIAEWVPPNPLFWGLTLLSSLGGFLLFFQKATSKEKIKIILLFPLSFLALKARRHLPFYYLYFFYLFLSFPPKSLRTFSQKNKILRFYFARVLLLFFLFISLTFCLPLTLVWFKNPCPSSNLNYPCQAVDFLRQQPEKGNIFNRYEWGGFLIWKLPEYKVFVDGRMPAWEHPSRKSPYTIYLETLQNQPGWEETLKKYNIDWILISPGTFMDLLLQPNPQNFGWKEVYRDKISVIYKRK